MLPIRDRVVLALAAAPGRHDVPHLTGYTEARFHARVRWLLDQPEAEAAMPVEVHRLRRLRDQRRAARRAPSGRRLATVMATPEPD